jgi:hypothetical protein
MNAKHAGTFAPQAEILIAGEVLVLISSSSFLCQYVSLFAPILNHFSSSDLIFFFCVIHLNAYLKLHSGEWAKPSANKPTLLGPFHSSWSTDRD